MDPPSYGRGPGGEIWKLEDCAYELISLAASLLSDNALFFLINSYTTGLSPLTMAHMMSMSLPKSLLRKGTLEAGETALRASSDGLLLPAGASARFSVRSGGGASI